LFEGEKQIDKVAATHLLNSSIIHLLNSSIIHLLNYSIIHLLNYSLTQLFNYSLTPPMRPIAIASLLAVILLSLSFTKKTEKAPKQNLSEYGFFTGSIADLKPAERVFFYEVNAPLFSDYAEKSRFIYLPPGAQMIGHPTEVFDFPTGTVIIKSFYYSNDVRHPEQGRRIIETRLLLREEKGWKALEYIWNEAQTDAVLEVAGATLPVAWKDEKGKQRQLDYVIPNLNQCKGCHSYDGRFVPIGTTTRQLNRDTEAGNQLIQWKNLGVLILPDDFDVKTAAHLTDYRQTALTAPAAEINRAARAYLDGNCAHCHNAHGPASTSGMFLGVENNDPERLGIGKPPVAAGRGSGNRRYGIVPGKPGESILLYRMESNDPGIRMPELGRQSAHQEGVELIKIWIKSL